MSTELDVTHQFFWGFFGGFLIICYRLWLWANNGRGSARFPFQSFRGVVMVGLVLLFPVLSGFVTLVCDPHYPLLAVFEGASAPSLFLVVAKEFDVGRPRNRGDG